MPNPQPGSSVLLLVLVLVGTQCSCSVSPRLSFTLGSPGRSVTSFRLRDVHNSTTLLLSPDQSTLYVGAQDAVLVLDVSHRQDIRLITKLEWRPSEKDTEQCSMKGKNVADCANFIRVLEFLNHTHIYACGTFAFSPRCVYVDTQTLSMSERSDEGRGRCPYDPYQPNTAITVDGELYTGTVADYRGNRPVISRHLSEASRGDLKLDDTLGWLEDPTFIRSVFVPSEEKIYFFFSEVGREYNFLERLLVSRVAQICITKRKRKRENRRRGGVGRRKEIMCDFKSSLPFQTGLVKCVTFLKIRVSMLPSSRAAIGLQSLLLSVHLISCHGSNHRVEIRTSAEWVSRVCGLHNASDSALRFVKENFLADESVRPVDRRLTAVSQHSYSHIRAQRVRSASGRRYTTLFLLTVSGYIHKVVLLQSGAHVIEEIQVFQHPQAVTSMKLSQGVVFIGTSEGVLRLPLANCSFYRTCAQCVLSQDPFCGWDSGRRACVEVGQSRDTPLAQDVERGQVDVVCVGSLTHRALFGPHIPTVSCPPGVLVTVSLNEVVRLHCPAPSLLSQQQWERPNSRLSEQLYLQLEDGSLSFVATPATLGHYLCVSVEKGFQQTMAVYQVRQSADPTPVPPASTAPPRATPGHTELSVHRDRGYRDALGGPCYLKELLIVTGLLVLCFSLLLTLLIYTLRLHCHNRTAPEPPTPPTGSRQRGAVPEQRAKGQHSPSSSNGHLPNVPL
ncbi:hypothetical protein WMY93_019115 [Mugilogobius chulae]|uniref:Sema domain-containing protein n=1 Tax=Mugilogobius chulae TaxID=88201 RepID=A0AAW0NPA1_9GOBI